jgi:hypothetical protein
LPDDVDSATVRSHLSHSGSTLTVTAHKKEQSQSAFGAAHGGATRSRLQLAIYKCKDKILYYINTKNIKIKLFMHKFKIRYSLK